MPLYEFKCEKCLQIEEHLMKISDPAPEKCAACGAKLHKIMSRTSFTLKGTGWYETDYKTSSTPKEESKSEPKAEKPSVETSAKAETAVEK